MTAYQGTKNYYALCLDMDGTLLNSQHEISEPNLRALRKLSHDLTIIPTSGRARISTEQVFGRMFERYAAKYLGDSAFEIPIIIAFNGALVYRNGSLIYENPIKGNAVDKIQKFVRDELPPNVVLIRYSHDNAFARVTSDNESRFLKYRTRNKYVKIEKISAFQEGGEPPKFIILANNKRELKSLVDILGEGNNLYVTWSGSDDEPQLEIMSAGVSKLRAVEKLIAYENRLPVNEKLIRPHSDKLTLGHFVTMGDSDNDWELLTASGLKIAPKNASQKVRNIEDILTTKSDNDGNCVAEAVNTYIAPLLYSPIKKDNVSNILRGLAFL